MYRSSELNWEYQVKKQKRRKYFYFVKFILRLRLFNDWRASKLFLKLSDISFVMFLQLSNKINSSLFKRKITRKNQDREFWGFSVLGSLWSDSELHYLWYFDNYVEVRQMGKKIARKIVFSWKILKMTKLNQEKKKFYLEKSKSILWREMIFSKLFPKLLTFSSMRSLHLIPNYTSRVDWIAFTL